MRRIESSGNADRATRLSCRAEARSQPNGFSTITRSPAGLCTTLSRARFRSCAVSQLEDATPTTGTLRALRFSIA